MNGPQFEGLSVGDFYHFELDDFGNAVIKRNQKVPEVV
jgi:hypothetical protein